MTDQTTDPTSEDQARTESIRQRLLASGLYPFLAEPLPGPRSRYFCFPRSQARFCWSTEATEGKYFSWVWAPRGPGARTGKAITFERTKTMTHATRKAAKARALRLYSQADTGLRQPGS
jgi:hypothetical protein